MTFTKERPRVTDATVVIKYKPKVFAPILPSCLTSPKPATPPTIENKTKGIAINLRQLIKITPNGSMKSMVNLFKPTEPENNAQTTPKNIPMRIFQCNANFFIMVFYTKVQLKTNLI